MFTYSFNIQKENKTKIIAEKISKNCEKGDVLAISGNMGVGKTTFIRYLINQLQKDNKLKITEVTSPTFNLLNEYQINKTKINHYDLFRLKSTEELKNLDLFADSQSVISVVEWPQIIKEKPKNLIELDFKYEDDHKKRSVKIRGIDF